MSSAPSTVVIGLGNPLMADEGLGLEVLGLLRARGVPPGVELIDGGAWGLTLLPAVEGASRVLFIDAISAGGPPGALHVVEREALCSTLQCKIFPHQVDLVDLLAVAQLRGTFPEQAVAFGLEPAVVEMSFGLSPVVAAHLGVLLDAVLARLAEWDDLPGVPRKVPASLG